ncbi:retron-type reverse transcriptase [Dysgonomonas sp. PFB1-18]|uniref:retron St85 family RNA-directed DNA polymerase n=1 Tax=unclassified Dysgonomonas TaxID=2630389 RepID=UPI0024751061|nr:MULTISPECIES: retron St85 family RNA-directed DNA polymerase [unclassified Dysgonomonas]MDH6310859.1 retron-type reverse transcriptase [Dysgonomonas sp. PF1-14]MDH6340703.1 retron-type reverse transcriptase [Dysgonomonas sp. PF1-16]MDH6382329.1 retron-type reverse transcriptase [Dysgonomonas sp. PFB1-18]MDH6399679.1 retron-type reverse transcriptase [Dysgonomonas sp. PF1-23]
MVIIIFVILLAALLVIIFIQSSERNSSYSNPKKYDPYHIMHGSYEVDIFDEEAVAWCANFLNVTPKELETILRNVRRQYTQFRIMKRSGGFRTISAPKPGLLAIQRNIYYRTLLAANVHPASTGFRRRVSIVDNANPHLGKKEILKVDIKDFFGSIDEDYVMKVFMNIGYPPNIAEIFAELCCLRMSLPQGAPTSPAISNVFAYEMDQKLTALALQYGLTYTRYADDLTFSGDAIEPEIIIPKIEEIVYEPGLELNKKKTRHIKEGRRKIITGISVSSGRKLTVPKAKKRELRKNVHYILSKGLESHKQHIGSTDPAYLKRILGYLSFWLSVEPDNKFVQESIAALRKLETPAQA